MLFLCCDNIVQMCVSLTIFIWLVLTLTKGLHSQNVSKKLITIFCEFYFLFQIQYFLKLCILKTENSEIFAKFL